MSIRSLLRTAFIIVSMCWCPVALADDAADGESVPVPATGDEPDNESAPLAATSDEPGSGQDAAPWGGSEDNTLKLSIQEAIDLGIQNNLGVEIQRFNPLIAEEDVAIAWGAYDPIWESEMGWQKDRLPTSFGLAGTSLSTGGTLDGQGGFVGLLPLVSTQYSAKLVSERSTTNSAVENLSPLYRSTTVFRLSQPLLRGLIWNEPWTRVKVSNIAYDSSLDAFRRDVMDIVTSIETAYWDLIATHEQMLVARKSLETSRALLEQTKTQYDVGVVSKVEVVQAEAGVADREFSLIVATNRYRQAQDDLIDRVLGEQLRPETTLAIQPTEDPEESVAYDVDVEQSTNLAFANRPELQLAQQNIEGLTIQEKFAKNQRLPQLDVVGSYFYQGLSGKNNPACQFGCSPVPSSDYGDSYNDFYDWNGANNWSVRGFLSIPIPNTSARHRATQAAIELRQARTQKRRVELDIIVEIRKAARDILSAQEGIEAAQRAVAAAAEQLRAEEIRLEYGESTPFDVLLREEDLVTAESQRILAFQTYRTSITALDRRQGTILRNRNIAIDQILSVR